MIAACLISFAVTALVGGRAILPALRRLKAGQSIREDGPKWQIGRAHVNSSHIATSRMPSSA